MDSCLHSKLKVDLAMKTTESVSLHQCLIVKCRRGTVSCAFGADSARRDIKGLFMGVVDSVRRDINGVVKGVAREAGIPKYASGWFFFIQQQRIRPNSRRKFSEKMTYKQGLIALFEIPIQVRNISSSCGKSEIVSGKQMSIISRACNGNQQTANTTTTVTSMVMAFFVVSWAFF